MSTIQTELYGPPAPTPSQPKWRTGDKPEAKPRTTVRELQMLEDSYALLHRQEVAEQDEILRQRLRVADLFRRRLAVAVVMMLLSFVVGMVAVEHGSSLGLFASIVLVLAAASLSLTALFFARRHYH